jgi:hypothetical protein
MLLSPVIGIAIDRVAPSAPTLHLVLALGFTLQALCFALLKVFISPDRRAQYILLTCTLCPQPPLMSSEFYRDSWNGRASTWAAGKDASRFCFTMF